MADRCTGQCCRSFYLPFNHEEHRELLTDRDPSWAKDTLYSHGLRITAMDGAMILSMVIPLPGDGPQQYTCKFFDGKNCGAYEVRPDMCKSYPYGKPCEHGDKCEWDDARYGRLPVIQG